ncbi:MAG TPA: ferrochelatase [Acidimicrobiales bacterium]|nr:ferrochelatase [Acidimicrobiales bacterium]
MAEVRGLLLMAYGTPATAADVAAYYTHVRRGRPPTPEQIAELIGRYEAIGGTSPLLERTRAQAAGLQSELGDGWRVALGMKHSPPFIEDGVAELKAMDAVNPVGLVLAPHYSRMSVGEYTERADGVDVIPEWHLEPGLIELLAERLVAARTPGAVALFTAHSLPARILSEDDPYTRQVVETAAAVAAAAGVTDWHVAWQSAGRTPEPWIGPDVLDAMRHLHRDVVVVPCGFVSDHLEILYDLDVVAQQVADDLGVSFRRTESLNDDPRFLRVLADVVRRH